MLELSEAVEAAAEALWTVTFENELAPQRWESADAEERARCRECAKATIDAAAPILERAWRARLTRGIEGRADELAGRARSEAAAGLLCQDEAESLVDVSIILRRLASEIGGNGRLDTAESTW